MKFDGVLPKDSYYHCLLCGGDFKRGNRKCAVVHPPGVCCHEYDEPFLKPFVDKNPTMFFLNSDKFKFKIVK
jgi:hypothetical protein